MSDPQELAKQIKALEAQLAALRAQQEEAPAGQRIEASDGSSISASPQVSANEITGSAFGSGNLVLHSISIAAGGVLNVGQPYADLPPDPAALREALITYLRTFLERYRYLSLQGITAASRQVPIALDAVFINVHTDRRIAESERLFATGRESNDERLAAILAGNARDAELDRWMAELFSAEERAMLRAAAKRGQLRTGNTIRNLVNRLSAPRTALELIRHYPALVLLGDPGSGKTTVLRHLALRFAFARLSAGDSDASPLPAELSWDGPLPLPVLVQLRGLAATLDRPPEGAGALLDFLEQRLRNDRLEPLARHLQARLEEGGVIVMLDGLDEIADDTRRAWAAQAAALFQSRFPRSRVVLTSRIYAYRDRCELPPPFQVVTLQQLDPGDQDNFIQRWYRAALLVGSAMIDAEQESVAVERARDLVVALERRPRLREIGGNPLLLTLMALVQQGRYRLPQQRARLYEECLLLLLEQWEQRLDERSGLAATLGIPDQTDRLALIQPVAYQLQATGREEASQSEVREWLTRRFLTLAQNDVSRADALIDRFLAFLEGRSGLLIARDIHDRYAFPHKTFQEYLAARDLIYREVARREVTAKRHNPTWREVILLVVGHQVASGRPLEAVQLGHDLLKADPVGTVEHDRGVVLAGEVLEELGDLLEEEGAALRGKVVPALVAIIEHGHLSSKERVEAAHLLGRLGDPRLPLPEQDAYWCNIEPGVFWHGDDREKAPLRQVELHYGFRIARYPVTNAEFQHFIKDGGYHERRWWTEQGWKYIEPGGQRWYEGEEQRITLPLLWHDSQYNGATQPVVGVSWYEAVAYCNWLTARGHHAGWLPERDIIRLPTSLQWERAARGTDQRRYPWGDDPPTPEHANYDETQLGAPAPVGCFPVGAAPCGALDMAGNVFEWTASEYGKEDEFTAQHDFELRDRISLPGGSWPAPVEYLCCGFQDWGNPYDGDFGQGIRVIWFRAPSIADNR